MSLSAENPKGRSQLNLMEEGSEKVFRSRKKISTTYAIVLFFLFFFLPTFS